VRMKFTGKPYKRATSNKHNSELHPDGADLARYHQRLGKYRHFCPCTLCSRVRADKLTLSPEPWTAIN
jgi:hypothetical protein